jgi:ATP-binding cassette subfamily C (CFTR/MRP) protein 1
LSDQIVNCAESGKSSFVLSLLNLLDISGSLVLDDVDITNVKLQHLRSHITTITQDPVVLPGSIRTNLFPFATESSFAEVDDGAMTSALSRVGLLEQIQNRGGLDADLSAMQLSAGEMQLLCLARAVLHNASTRSHVVLIDEATSNMDRDTEERARLVFKDFSTSGCTVIMVAHRMDTIQDADIILELSHGKITNIFEKGTVTAQSGPNFVS